MDDLELGNVETAPAAANVHQVAGGRPKFRQEEDA